MTEKSALLLIDLQFDFLETGALPVPEGSQVLAPICRLAQSFEIVVATQDWHPAGHKSFASSHPGKSPYDTLLWKGQEEVLWPDHCVQDSKGADLHPSILQLDPKMIIQKGTDPETDSYSAFFDNHRENKTLLDAWLRENGIRNLVVAGLATDYCVKFSVLDALSLGYSVQVFTEGSRGVNVRAEDSENAFRTMWESGALPWIS
jgi:nicotinamidase/pyrazinamidase